MELTAVLTHAEEGGYVALNHEAGTTTQGETGACACLSYRISRALRFRTPWSGSDFRKCARAEAMSLIGTLAGLLRQAEVTAEEFMRALRK